MSGHTNTVVSKDTYSFDGKKSFEDCNPKSFANVSHYILAI